jgi:hypothetical protein
MNDRVGHDAFPRRMDVARAAFLAGRASVLAYATGVDECDLVRVGGVEQRDPSVGREPLEVDGGDNAVDG